MPMQYENERRTRVYRPEHDISRPDPHDERIGFTQPLAKPKGIFDGLSIAQVIAGAAAAATSMLLASKLGIAGSVIGAAASSAVTITCSQLYRHALDASAKKLRDSRLASSVDADLPLAQRGNKAGKHASNDRSAHTPYVSGFDTSTPTRTARVAPINLQERAAQERDASQRKVVIASIAIAALAVILSAGAILLSTSGHGLGDRPAPLLPVAALQPADAGQPDGNGDTARTDANQPDGNGGVGADGGATAPSGEDAKGDPSPNDGSAADNQNGNDGASSSVPDSAGGDLGSGTGAGESEGADESSGSNAGQGSSALNE